MIGTKSDGHKLVIPERQGFFLSGLCSNYFHLSKQQLALESLKNFILETTRLFLQCVYVVDNLKRRWRCISVTKKL